MPEARPDTLVHLAVDIHIDEIRMVSRANKFDQEENGLPYKRSL